MAMMDPMEFGLDEPPPRPTTPPVRMGFVVILILLSLAATIVYGVPYVAESAGYAWETGRARAATAALIKLDEAGVVNRASELFRLATVAVSPAVVNIQTEKFRGDHTAPGLPLGGGGRFGRGFESLSVGSGVIIDKDHGYVVTNNHVIDGADRISVRLSQGVEAVARLVAADPPTDLAVLQLKTPVKIAGEWGDSDKLSIGDWVLAIGSPFMLDHTVTAGIVSATGRNNLVLPGMDSNAYQDFIQTDAAINPGNSGGPLIDLNGKIIGINTAILTSGSVGAGEGGMGGSSGGFEGIGLAIPSAIAKRVVKDLIEKGKVTRGYLGVAIQPINPTIASEFKLGETRGTLVSGVQSGSPADKAGVKVGDVIVRIDGRETPDPPSLRNKTAAIEPGSEAEVEIVRDGAPQTIKIVVGQLDAIATAALSEYGFTVREIPDGPEGRKPPGLLIGSVVVGGVADRAGLRPGMLILGVGRAPIAGRDDFERALSRFTPEQGLPLVVALPDGRQSVVTLGGRK